MIKRVLIFLVVIASVLAGAYFYVSRAAQKPPENSPARFLAQPAAPGKKVLVCMGDSITHGRVSCNYVDELAERLAPGGFVLVNAGINSELAWNVLERIDEVVACRPDVVTVLVGTNDANATLSEENTARAMRQMKLPKRPDSAWFRFNLEKIVAVLKAKTSARIALISLPPMGEDRGHAAYRRATDYSRIIRETAEATQVTYLPLNEVMDNFLAAHPHQPRVGYDDNPRNVMYKMLASRFFLGKTWDEISSDNGQQLLIDILHPNCRGAGIIADLIERFALENGAS